MELDAREQLLLDAAGEQADAIEALEQDVRERGFVVDGMVNPAAREARQGRQEAAGLLDSYLVTQRRRSEERRGLQSRNTLLREGSRRA